MSVKIEILDYDYQTIESSKINASTGSFQSVGSWNITPSGSWVISGGDAQKITGTGAGYLQHPMTFQEGQTYRIRGLISGLTTSGSLILANHLAGNANGFSRNTNGGFSYDWVQGAGNLDKLSLYGSSTFDGKVEYAYVYHLTNIDWENSVVGELDVSSHSDFPLAMTFQISDFKDLTSTTGDYSKTFKIPATKNNNNILKHLYIPNISVDNKVTDKKSCRILFDNLYSLVGLLQVDGVGGYGETPSYYNCVFYGNNLNWADSMEDTYMNAPELWEDEGENLAYNKDSIVATWQHEDCNNSSNSPIVYPITSYGDYNELGNERKIQLLDTAYDYNQTGSTDKKGYYGFFNDGSSYETPLPVADWRPSVFVKTTLDKIFNSAGYNINSAFMETDMFKKLVWLLPNFKYNNPDERVEKYSVRSNFENGVSMTTGSITSNPATDPIITENGIQRFYEGELQEEDGNYFYTGDGQEILDLETIISDPSSYNLNVYLDNGSYVDLTDNYVTIGEYGQYQISLNGLQSRVARVFKGGTENVVVDRIDSIVNLELQTVGQSSWVIIDSGSNSHTIDAYVDENIDRNTNYKDIPNISIQRYLNKGDKIRISLGVRLFCDQRDWQKFVTYIFFSSKSTSNFKIELQPKYVEYGQTYNLKDVISADYRQLDFIKGVSHAFNLKMTTDESTRTVNIEPFDSFYKPYGDAIDWTYKLDRGNQINDKWLESDLKRYFVFKYKSDNADVKVKTRGEQFFNQIQDEYPYWETLPKTFKKGESKFENPFFAGTYNGKDVDTVSNSAFNDTAFSACLWTENAHSYLAGRPVKGYDFLPRLLYWNKYSPNPSNMNGKRAFVQTWSNTTEIISAGVTGSTGLLSTIYPQATMVNRDSTSSPNLAYGNAWVRDYDDVTLVYTNYQTGEGLYDTYYRNMFEGLKRSPRVRTVSIDLNVGDIINLDFRKLVYIDGVYWRLNKIIDYMPNKNESTKVELIEWFQIGIFAASAPTFGSSGTTDNWDGSIDDGGDFNLFG